MPQVAQPRGDRGQSVELRTPRAEQRDGLVEAQRHAPLARRARRSWWPLGGAGAWGMSASLLRCSSMKVAALAGGIGAGKFLRGMARVVPGDDLTVILNVADDIVVHGLHVSPDPDSVTYWLGDAFDRERGWGRRDESFRATDELRAFGAPDAWFNLGDLDLAAHVMRSSMLRQGATMSQVVARVAERFGVGARLLPVTDDRVETRIDAVDARTGERLDLHFQEYWVQRRASDAVKSVRFVGVEAARPAPGVLAAIEQADVVVLPPSNPVVSLGPILAVRGCVMLSGLAARQSWA